MVLIYNEESDPPADAPPMDEVIAAYNAYGSMLRARGQWVASEALHPIATATTLRVRDGKTLTTDGPFAETKEVLGGFYQIEAKDLDEALELAAMCPGARWGTVEVRPIVDFAAGQLPG
jgi:hypothetical protein